MASLNQANSFELSGKSIHVSYASTSFLGGPTFSYRDDQLSRSFSREEINLEETEIGHVITVTLKAIADGDRVTFSLVLPKVTLRTQSHGIRIKVPGITITNPSTIAGPPPGPEKLYSVVNLKGTAHFVVS